MDKINSENYSAIVTRLKVLSKIKIDKSFIMDMNHDDNDAMIVRSTMYLAQNHGMQVIAEGIEEDKQLRFLKKKGCDTGQGFLFCKPLPPEELETRLSMSNEVEVAASIENSL